MSTLTIKSVKCIKPSSGINKTTRGIFAIAGGVVGAGTSFAGATVTGGALLATVSLAAAGGGGVGVSVINALDEVFAGSDDLYIKINGNKVWPSSGKYEGIDSQQTKYVNISQSFNGSIRIELMEYDFISSDDSLGYLEFEQPTKSEEGKFAVLNENEGSIYELDIRIDV